MANGKWQVATHQINPRETYFDIISFYIAGKVINHHDITINNSIHAKALIEMGEFMEPAKSY
jgi:hypothetical protein